MCILWDTCHICEAVSQSIVSKLHFSFKINYFWDERTPEMYGTGIGTPNCGCWRKISDFGFKMD